VSALIGGLVSDRYQKRNPLIMSQVSALGAMLTLPVAIGAFAVTGNFWISITCLALKYLLGENWLSPSITMM
jgi:hypothetical protein